MYRPQACKPCMRTYAVAVSGILSGYFRLPKQRALPPWLLQRADCVDAMAAYPGDGYKMSNYGHKTYTPEQTKEQWRESCTREHRISESHGATKTRRDSGGSLDLSEGMTYFNTHKTHAKVSSYDRGFHVVEGYSQRLKRDDLQHTQDLDVVGEEEARPVPVLANSEYGNRLPVETPDRQHVRVGLVKREFYRATGTNIGQ